VITVTKKELALYIGRALFLKEVGLGNWKVK